MGLSLPGPYEGSGHRSLLQLPLCAHSIEDGRGHGLDHNARSFQISFSATLVKYQNQRGRWPTQLPQSHCKEAQGPELA